MCRPATAHDMDTRCCTAPCGATCVLGLRAQRWYPLLGCQVCAGREGLGSARFSASRQPPSLVRSARSTAALGRAGMVTLWSPRSVMLFKAFRVIVQCHCTRRTSTPACCTTRAGAAAPPPCRPAAAAAGGTTQRAPARPGACLGRPPSGPTHVASLAPRTCRQPGEIACAAGAEQADTSAEAGAGHGTRRQASQRRPRGRSASGATAHSHDMMHVGATQDTGGRRTSAPSGAAASSASITFTGDACQRV